MELLRFREIRERVKKIVELIDAINNETIKLTSKQSENIEADYKSLLDEIHNSDLSNISYEEFRGFYDIGFDFSGTRANIDFDLIDVSHNEGKLRFQGCNLRHIDLSKVNIDRIDDQSFDSDVIKANSYFRKNISKYVIFFSKEQEKLRGKFYERELTLRDISENLKLFKGKKFIDRLNYSTSSSLRSASPDITEEKITYLMEQLPNISDLIIGNASNFAYVANVIDIEKSPQENKTAIVDLFRSYKNANPMDNYTSIGIAADSVIREMSSYEELISDPILNLSERDKYYMLKLISSPSLARLEALEAIDIKYLIQSRNIKFFEFFDRYGIDTVLDFEKANGPFFTKDGGSLISFVGAAYMAFAANNRDPKTSLYGMKSLDDPNPKYTNEQFEEYVRRMIVYGPTDRKYKYKNKMDYRELRGPFRDEHLDLFLPEDAPEELQDKFYKTVIAIEDISRHPEYIRYLKDVDVGISLEYLPFLVEGQHEEDWHFFKDKAGSTEEALNFITENVNVIKYLKKGSDYLIPDVTRDMSLDDVLLIFNKKIEDRIINQNLSYGEDAPEYFKANHKDYFLEDDAPDILKNAFYPDRRKKEGDHTVFFDKEGIKELTEQKGWQQYLIGKQKDIRKSLLEDFISKADNQAIEETFRYYLDKDYEIVIELISFLTADSILRMKITIPDEILEKLIEKGKNDTLKILLFSEKVDREKIQLLSRYKELNNQTNTLDSALSSIYLENRGDVDELNRKIDEIYYLFTFDNIPEFLKTYKLFELGKFALVKNKRIKSYFGVNEKLKRNIILTDLFRTSLDSNSKSMKDFANILKYGDEILSKVAENGQLDLSSLSEAEHAVFSQYIDTLVSMHNISASNSENKKIIKLTHDIETNLSSLQQQYGNGELQFSSSRVLTGLFNGEITSELTPDSILIYMENKREQRLQEIRENSNLIKNKSLRLESGDFIKGIRDFKSYLKSMLRYGLRCGEFNRENSHSDYTELDLDFGYVSDANLKPFKACKKTDYDVILTTISATYGNTYIVLKDYGKKFKQEFQEQEDEPIIFLRGPEYWTNFPDDEVEAKNKDRYVRTGIGVLDIDYIVSTEWNSSLEYEMAMAGVYIPVKNEKEELIFSYEDYEAIRAKMKGLSYYETAPFELDEKTKQMRPLYEVYRKYGGDNVKIEECEGIIKGKDDSITTSKKEATLKTIHEFFDSKKIHVAYNLSSNLAVDEIEFIDTGSTGRGTNVPGDGDFDFMLRHNLPPEVLSEFQSYMFKLPRENAISLPDGFRLKQVLLPDGQKVDIDVTYAKKDLSLVYSSDISIKDRLKSIKQNSIEDYNYVRANIIMAKNILKKLGIYKKRGSDGATEYGGFGGIGVENWILQNGGSFAQAINTYLEATKDENGKDLSYQEFIQKYPIFDFGNNHREGRLLHDKFSSFLGNASKDNLEQAFSYVKENFREIQREFRDYQQPKEYAPTDQEPSILRKSISVGEIREASKRSFEVFCKENFVLMENLIAKYSKGREEGTRYQGKQLTNGGFSL